MVENILIVGASGGIGRALIEAALLRYPEARIAAWSRQRPDGLPAGIDWHRADITLEPSIAEAAQALRSLDLVVVATGLLHRPAMDGQPAFEPEKTWRAISGEAMAESFLINAIAPALIAKHVLPLLPRDRRAVFAALSARVGSIADNRLGGWYSYRASKAALNQIIKTLSIELAVKAPHAICVGLHPGTVDTPLSKPFQANVQVGQMSAPDVTAERLFTVIDGLEGQHSGRVLDWSGAIVPE